MRKSYFQSPFREDNRENISEVIQLSQLFPRLVSEEYNQGLIKEISEDELKETLHSFQKEKIFGSDGWTI